MSVVERATAAVAAVRAAFADADALAGVSAQELVDLLSLAGEVTRVAGAQQVRLAGEIAERSKGPDDASICRYLGGARPRDAIGAAFGVTGRQAGELIGLAEFTKTAVSMTGETIAIKYPRVAAALDAGELSVGQAQAIVKTLDPAASRADLEQLARAEGWLVHSATDPETPLVPELLVTQARAFVAVLDPDGVLPNAERQRAARGVRSWVLPDGTKKYLIIAPPEEGAQLDAALDAFASPRVRFVDTGAESAATDDRTFPQKKFDGFMSMITAQVATGGTPIAGGEVPRLVLTGTIEAYDAYLRGVDHRDRTLTAEHTGSIVPIEAVDRIICDGVVQRAVVDKHGHVLDLGREQRTFNKAQRRALAAQYKGCANATCTLPVASCEAHHVIWWEHDGPTDLENGILLCGRCHHEVHAGRLRVVGSKGNWRVVAKLQPSYRYARNPRTGQSLRPGPAPIEAAALLDGEVDRALTGAAHGSIAHAARPSLAVKLSDPPDQEALGSLQPRRSAARPVPQLSHPGLSPIERRLRLRWPRARRAERRRPAIDRGPPPRIVLRT